MTEHNGNFITWTCLGKRAKILQHNQKTILKKEKKKKESEFRIHAYGFQQQKNIFKKLFGFFFNFASDPLPSFSIIIMTSCSDL